MTSRPGSNPAQQRKIRQAQRAAGDTPVLVLAHAHGPEENFRRRMQTARQAARHGVWVNRYGYLSHPKLQILGEVFSSGESTPAVARHFERWWLVRKPPVGHNDSGPFVSN